LTICEKYLPFGVCRNSPDLPTDKLFTGQRLDATGLYYYNARYYDPTIGRFISPDTVVQSIFNPQCLNRYSYCLNNPLKYTDPSGHFVWALAFLYCIPGIGEIALVVSVVAVTVIGGAYLYDIAVSNDGHTIIVPPPYFGPNKSWEPGDPPTRWDGPDPGLIAKIALGTVGVTVTVLGVAGKIQEADETGYPDPELPLKKEPIIYSHITFSDGSSGYFSLNQVYQIPQFGTITSIDSTGFSHVTFSDGSSGYFTPDQVVQLQQMGASISNIELE
jgi:RHS repeat-associated protein